MHPPPLIKYAFRIRTRVGMVVDHLTIHGRDEVEAERKLRQIYRDCEILSKACMRGNSRPPPSNYEDVVSLITR